MTTLDTSTRDRIVHAATEMFMERGYDKTTMRDIAKRAGVSIGNAYYYFGGKEDLVQGFYLSIAREHAGLAQQRMEGLTSFKDRLDAAFTAFLDTCERYRQMSDTLLVLAVVPTSPLNPFSQESRPARERFIAVYAEVVEGSDLKTDPRLREALPELLWMVHMVITLGWVQDLSADQRVTRTLVKRLSPSLGRLLSVVRLAPFRPFVDDALEGLAAIKESRGL